MGDETFFDARDWEGDVEELEKKLTREKKLQVKQGKKAIMGRRYN